MKKGVVYKILQDVYKARCTGNMEEVQKRIVRVQISLKTGLNLRDFTTDTVDSESDISKVLSVVKGPGIGLKDYHYKEQG